MVRISLGDFRPQKKDLEKTLGGLESEILSSLWSLEKASVKEIQARLSRKRPVAITTIATVLDRMYSKGLVDREISREGGIHFVYNPSVNEREFRSSVAESVLNGLLESFAEPTVSYLIKQMDLKDRREAAVLKRYLARLAERRKR